MRIAYLGYDLLSPCLDALADSGCEVMAVYSFPTDNEFEFNRAVRAFADGWGIPFTDQRITLAEIHRLKDAGCQALFCAGYIYRVPVDHSLPIVNVHPALLPVGRGAWPMPVTILRQLPVSGVTLHRMEPELDVGDILLQEAFPVGPEDTLETVTEQIRRVGAALCRQVMTDFTGYWDAARPQGEGEYWPEPTQADRTFAPDAPPEETDRILRAFLGFDCYLRTETGDLRLVGGRFRPMDHHRPFGAWEPLPGGGKRYYVRGGAVETP